MNAEFVMVPCPVCCREQRLPITARYSVWKMWARPCFYCQYVDGSGGWLPRPTDVPMSRTLETSSAGAA